MELGGTPILVATLGPAYAFTALALRPISGILSDKGYTIRLLITGSIVNALAHGMFLISASVIAIYIGRLIQGLSIALFIPASLHQAALGSENKAVRSIAVRSTMIGLSQALGPGIGGYLVENYGWEYLFSFSILVSILGLLFIVLGSDSHGKDYGGVIERSDTKYDSGFSRFKNLLNVSFITATSVLFIYSMSYMSLIMALPALHEELGLGSILVAIFFTALATTNLLARIIYVKIVSNGNAEYLALAGVFSTFMGFLLVSLDPVSASIVMWGMISGIGVGFLFPSLQIIALTRLKPEVRGIGASIYTSMFDLGFLIGPPILIGFTGNYIEAIRYSALITGLGFVPLIIKIYIRKFRELR